MTRGGAATARPVHSALAVLGAFSFANTLVWGRAAQRAGADIPAMLTVRFALTGTLLLALLGMSGRPLVPARGERSIVVVLGIVAYGLESMAFFEALARGTAAAVVLLFYTHVVVVAVGETLLGGLRPSLRIAAAVALALGGGALVALGGGAVAISGAGVLFVSGSIASYSTYVLVSARLVRRTEAITAAAWVAFAAAAGVAGWGTIAGFGSMPAAALGDVTVMAAATAAAFALWFVVVSRLGSARTAIIMMLEAPFAIVLTRVAFGDEIRAVVALGGVLVLAGALLAAFVEPPAATALEAGTAP